MNRRQLFRNAVGLAGAAVIAPKVALEALPTGPIACTKIVQIENIQKLNYYFEQPECFYSALVKLCQQFFPNQFYITENLKTHTVGIDIPSDTHACDIEMFERGLWFIRPIGVLCTVNGKQAANFYDEWEA